jgi:hypothetical protein
MISGQNEPHKQCGGVVHLAGQGRFAKQSWKHRRQARRRGKKKRPANAGRRKNYIRQCFMLAFMGVWG